MRHVLLVFFLLTAAAVLWGVVSGDWAAAMPGIVLGAGPLLTLSVVLAVAAGVDRFGRWRLALARARQSHVTVNTPPPATVTLRVDEWTPAVERRVRARAGKRRGRK